MTPTFNRYVVSGIGVREARLPSHGGLDIRVRDGRTQYRLQILKSRSGTASVGEPQWVDRTLVFSNRDAAVDLYRRARKHAPIIGRTIWAAAIELVNTNSELHPTWPGNQGDEKSPEFIRGMLSRRGNR